MASTLQELMDQSPDPDAVPDVIMWQVHQGGRWSRVHRLNDEQTTLCGIRIPVHYDADYGHNPECKRCLAVLHSRRQTRS